MRALLRQTRQSRWFSTFSPKAAIVDDPYSGNIYCEVPYIENSKADELVKKMSKAQRYWKTTKLDQRIEICKGVVDQFKKNKEKISLDISHMMGKPLKQARNEVEGLITRANAMIDLAPNALAPEVIPGSPKGILRKIVREPVGVVLVLAPWNYPLLTAVNAIIPAVLAGNVVLLKHSPRTPLVANAFENAFRAAGAEDLVAALHVDHSGVAHVIGRPEINYIHFTGSVQGGHQVYSTAAKRFVEVGLELGGKDPAYVREDCDLAHAVDSIVDGGMYNAGQSCCGLERVYVHKSLYDKFLEKSHQLIKDYVLGDPQNDSTSLGPMAQPNAIKVLTDQVQDAKKKGAKIIIGGESVHDKNGKGRFFLPTLIANCDHKMEVMREENFGPILAVTKVDDDKHAIDLMNDSHYGLTAAIYTNDVKKGEEMSQYLDCGTVFLNRCDYLDPYLPWTGIKDSGKGISLSRHGFTPFTRLKSLNFRDLQAK